ncbi:MAG: Glutamyl-tRNA(Gln) amidotransferase subunit C [Chlamydiae bacterium]|nr:Glutamyl-tRNA(Gln) amidotransferase subunit C [Chlamydiota bacterium]
MSNFTEKDLKELSQLCRIQLSEEEIPDLLQSLKRVLDYVELLKEVDVSHISPYSRMGEQGVDSLRDDEVKEPLSREVFLENAPDHIGGMIRVPPVIKQNP